MPTECQIQETLARRVATMAFYHNRARTPRPTDLTVAEVRLVVGLVEGLGLDAGGVERFLVRIERYGHEVGPRSLVEFVNAFDGTEVIEGRCRKVLAWHGRKPSANRPTAEPAPC